MKIISKVSQFLLCNVQNRDQMENNCEDLTPQG